MVNRQRDIHTEDDWKLMTRTDEETPAEDKIITLDKRWMCVYSIDYYSTLGEEYVVCVDLFNGNTEEPYDGEHPLGVMADHGSRGWPEMFPATIPDTLLVDPKWLTDRELFVLRMTADNKGLDLMGLYEHTLDTIQDIINDRNITQ